SFIGRATADLLLHLVEPPDPFERLKSKRRGDRYMDVVKLAPHVSPASRLLDLLTIEPIEAGIGIGLQHSGEVRQVRSGSLALAIGRVPEEHRRRLRASCGAVVPDIRPQSSLLSRAATRTQHRHRSVIAMELVSREHISAHRADERLEQGTRLANPVSEG